jgi:hypothetical protein
MRSRDERRELLTAIAELEGRLADAQERIGALTTGFAEARAAAAVELRRQLLANEKQARINAALAGGGDPLCRPRHLPASGAAVVSAHGRDKLVDQIAAEVAALAARVRRLEQIIESGVRTECGLELAELQCEFDLARDEQRAVNQLLAAELGGVLVPVPRPKPRGRRPHLVVDNTGSEGGPPDAD